MDRWDEIWLGSQHFAVIEQWYQGKRPQQSVFQHEYKHNKLFCAS